ncbi:MAG: ABC transporter ATP-binding protein [Lachnospiraceae bacterium]|nr:ABC transporter ATP-binding protein [Lachnospiraceae bacterium]
MSRLERKPLKPFIEFCHVDRKYRMGENDFYALKDVNLEIYDGEMVVILGPSGAGKSTLLNLLGGMDSPTSGNIFFNGHDISKFKDDELTAYRAWNIGVVFQFYNLVPTLTAYENVALMKDVRKNVKRGSIWEAENKDVSLLDPKEALISVGLKDHLNQFPSQMSGGEQQRTSIARALAKNPKLLLCDEPTGALDTKTGREVLKLLQDMSREKKHTVVMVTHNSFFADIADRVIRVKNGTIESVEINDQPKDASEVNW